MLTETLKLLFNRDINLLKVEIESYKNEDKNLTTHLTYHLGQINYHRRLLDC